MDRIYPASSSDTLINVSAMMYVCRKYISPLFLLIFPPKPSACRFNYINKRNDLTNISIKFKFVENIGPKTSSATAATAKLVWDMMTSSNGNIIRVTGPLCGNSPVTDEFPSQRPVTRSFDVFFDLRLNKQRCKQIVRLVIWYAFVPIMTSL